MTSAVPMHGRIEWYQHQNQSSRERMNAMRAGKSGALAGGKIINLRANADKTNGHAHHHHGPRQRQTLVHMLAALELGPDHNKSREYETQREASCGACELERHPDVGD